MTLTSASCLYYLFLLISVHNNKLQSFHHQIILNFLSIDRKKTFVVLWYAGFFKKLSPTLIVQMGDTDQQFFAYPHLLPKIIKDGDWQMAFMLRA